MNKRVKQIINKNPLKIDNFLKKNNAKLGVLKNLSILIILTNYLLIALNK